MASVCPYCGQKTINVAQGTGVDTPFRAYEGQLVNSGIEKRKNNQKRPKKKHPIWIAVGIVLVCIILFSLFAGKLMYGGQTADNGSEDDYFDDVIESIQGDWYLWVKNEFWHFSIEGTDYELFIQDTKTLEITNASGHIEPVEGTYSVNDTLGYISGELKFSDSSTEKTIEYRYPDRVDGSTELKYEGDGLGDTKMARYDYFGRIMELLQGQWIWTATGESGNEYYLTLKVEDNNYELLISNAGEYTIYAGRMSMYSDGRIYLCNDDDIVLLELRIKYDEDTDSIALSDGDIVIEQSQMPW